VRLLFISSFYLFGGTRFGGAKRLYYFAREWSRSAEVTLINLDVCLEGPASAAPHPEFRDGLVLPGTKGPGFRERFLSAHEDLRPLVRAHRERIGRFLAGREFDAILLAFPWALAFLDDPAVAGLRAPVTYLEDDLAFERYRAEAASARGSWAKAAKLVRLRQALAFYRPRLRRVSRFVGISRQELDAMGREFPGPARFLASYGLPLEEYPLLPPPREGFTLGFIGNYGHPPNADALRWLADGLAAAIRERCPGTRFILAGKGIPAWAPDAFRDLPAVELLEDVAELGDFYGRISAFLNPIRTGRGMRTKLLEAAAFGRPIVSTRLGAEGLDDLEIGIGDGAEGLARACSRLAGDADPRAAAIRNRAVVESRYSLGKVAADLLGFMVPA
jgi:polysaccharide biosynthesis protein PslH